MIVEKIVNEWKDVPLDLKRRMVEDYLDDVINSLPEDIVDLAIYHLRRNILTETQLEIDNLFKEHGVVWWTKPEIHNGFGLRVRNMLRDLVCLDDDLPTGNWDDYYSQLVEASIGLRKIQTRKMA